MVVVTFAVALFAVRGAAPVVLDEQARVAAAVTPSAVAMSSKIEAVATSQPAPDIAPPRATAPVAAAQTLQSAPTPLPMPAVGSAAPPGSAAAPQPLGEATGQVVSAPASGPLLPTYRIVTFYGHPHDPGMGIVGEYDMEDLAQRIRDEAANYAAADPSRPVIPAFELIATVAQGVPVDGTYILDTDKQTLQSYIDYATKNGMLVVLDLQIGRGSVSADLEKVRDLLALPNVHLALDPEFAVKEGEVPGEYIGSLGADSITYVQQELAKISAENNIPPKILIVHQFREDMIQGKDRLAPYPGVQLVIDADGYGVPELKTAVYNVLVRDEPVEFAGVKIFYKQDVPVMSAQEILGLVPPPDVIIYQ